MHACKNGNMTSAAKMLELGADWLQKDDHGKIAKQLVKPYSKDPERNQKLFEDALRAHMSVETVESKYPARYRPNWIDRQVQEEEDEAFRIAEDKYITQVLEEEAEMKKQEDLERSREAAEIARIAEEERKKQEAFDALPEEEKRKILKKQAKRRLFASKRLWRILKNTVSLYQKNLPIWWMFQKPRARRTPPHRRIKARNEESVLPAPIVTAHLLFYVLRSGE